MTTVTITLTHVECSECGINYGLSGHYERKRTEDHKTFYCPNGHNQHFPAESEAEKLRRQLKDQQKYADNLNAQLTQSESSLRATKGVVTKLRKRASNGVCAFCHRHFVNVERHVSTKHPDA